MNTYKQKTYPNKYPALAYYTEGRRCCVSFDDWEEAEEHKKLVGGEFFTTTSHDWRTLASCADLAGV